MRRDLMKGRLLAGILAVVGLVGVAICGSGLLTAPRVLAASDESEETAQALQYYRDGVKLYRQGSYAEAIAAFEKVLAQISDHRGARTYLEAAKKRLAQLEAEQERKRVEKEKADATAKAKAEARARREEEKRIREEARAKARAQELKKREDSKAAADKAKTVARAKREEEKRAREEAKARAKAEELKRQEEAAAIQPSGENGGEVAPAAEPEGVKEAEETGAAEEVPVPEKPAEPADAAQELAQQEVGERVRHLGAERDERVRSHYEAGLVHMKARNYAAAITEFDAFLKEPTVLRSDPRVAEVTTILAEARSKLAVEQREKERTAQREKVLATGRSEKEKQRKAAFISRHMGDARSAGRTGRWEEAVKEYEAVLKVDPQNSEASGLLDQAKKQVDKQKLTAETNVTVLQYMQEGATLYHQGKYTDAISRWKEVLNLTRAGETAHRKAVEWIHKAEVSDYQEKIEALQPAKAAEQARLLAEVDEGWISPKPLRGEAAEPTVVPVAPTAPTGVGITDKLRQPVSLTFKDAHIRVVLGFLSDITGVNIVLDENVFPPGGEEGAPIGAGYVSPKVTIDLKNVPLVEVLEYILRAKGLAYRIEEHVVWITTPETLERERMMTRVFRLSSGITGITEFGGVAGGVAEAAGGGEWAAAGGAPAGGAEAVAPTETIEDILAKAVPWPEGSTRHLDRRTGTLIVTNTPTNMKLVEKVIQEIDKPPFQVLIEAKFVEMTEEALEKISAEFPYVRFPDWGRGDLRWRGSLAMQHPDVGIETDHLGIDSSTSGVQMQYTKLSDSQFRLLLEAIRGTYGARVLSAPRVTTINQQEAVIKVVQEYRFAGDDWEQVYYIDPTGEATGGFQAWDIIPVSFEEPEEYGITLTVTPDVGSDRRTVTLTLVPEVSELLDWVRYGVTVTSLAEQGQVSVRLEPITEIRDIHTRVVVEDSETVVMGGLLRERMGEDVRKIPFLSDIPLLGKFFRSESKTDRKSNLLIFVTVQLLKPTGERLWPPE